MIINTNNCHEAILNYVEENTVEINTYEDMKNTYANMILADYYFIIERDLIADILVDLTYRLSSNATNRGRVIGTIDMEDNDDNHSYDSD
tara:strand:+ start:920 stop:1189 length:270 start_codon:yes stop_codon:yes gene_type:complete